MSLSSIETPGVATPPPMIYKHGMALFRSIYTLLRTLPAWGLHKRIRRRTQRAGALSISLRLRPPSSPRHSASSYRTLEFQQRPAPPLSPIPTQTQDFPPVQLPPGTLTFSVTYLATPSFEIDELESVLSSRFISDDVGGELAHAEGFVPTLMNKSSSTTASRVPHGSGAGSRGNSPPGPGMVYAPGRGSAATRSPMAIHKEPSESIAERFILPAKTSVPPGGGISGSPRDPLARLRKESVSAHPPHNTTPSPTNSPRQRKLSLNSSSPSSSIVSQGPFLTGSMNVPPPTTTTGSTTAMTGATTASPLPIRRPNLNPFKTNTISSPSNSSPSISLRTGGNPSSLSNPTNLAPAPTGPPPSPLSAHAPPPSTLGGQPSSDSSIQSNTHLRHGSIGSGRPPPSPILPPGYPISERERRMSSLSTMSIGERTPFPAGTTSTTGGEGGAGPSPSSPVPVPPPTRKRYSSSFGRRYAGSVGSNASGGAVAGAATGGPAVATGATGVGGGTASGPGSDGTSGVAGIAPGIQRPGTPEVLGKPVSNSYP